MAKKKSSAVVDAALAASDAAFYDAQRSLVKEVLLAAWEVEMDDGGALFQYLCTPALVDQAVSKTLALLTDGKALADLRRNSKVTGQPV